MEPVTGIELVLVPPGSFWMGTPDDEPLRESQELLHHVRLTRAFYLGRYEVTQGEWRRVMGSNPGRFLDCGSRCPVETVSFQDVQRFFERVTELGGPALRLPTEAEWEYACRAGSQTAFAHGPTLGPNDANFDGTSPYPGSPPGLVRGTTTPVGTFPANAWGFHDLHGNVWEWTSDRHCPYAGDVIDPRPSCDSKVLVIRGGSWHFGADSARCGLRYTHRPQDDGPSLGFRVALDPPEQ